MASALLRCGDILYHRLGRFATVKEAMDSLWDWEHVEICSFFWSIQCNPVLRMRPGHVWENNCLSVLSSWMWLFFFCSLYCCFSIDENQTTDVCTWKTSMAEFQGTTSPFTFGLLKGRHVESFHSYIAFLSQKTNIAWGKHSETGYLQPQERIGNDFK